ncbi:MAG: hypothetical protein INR62_11775 [Rhodospirillales bacterium]|nr:hypothetical protein [Acetobacter sp.]
MPLPFVARPTTIHLLPGPLSGSFGTAAPEMLSVNLQVSGHIAVRNDLITILENYFHLQLLLEGACIGHILSPAFTWWQPYNPGQPFTPVQFNLTCGNDPDLSIKLQKTSTDTQDGQPVHFDLDGDTLTQILKSGGANDISIRFENLLPSGGHVNHITVSLRKK